MTDALRPGLVDTGAERRTVAAETPRSPGVARGHGSSAPPSGGSRSPAWRALTAAAADVAASWPVEEHTRVAPSDVRSTVAILVDALQAVVGGGSANLTGVPTFVPARRVLESVRQSFLEHCQAPDVREFLDEVVDILRAMEKIQELLDADAAHRFASRLTGTDAQQLVVEMAHDMRSPLGSILILAERLRAGAGGDLAAIQVRQLGLIYSAAFGLSALAGDVIELARGGTTLVDQEPMAFAVSDVLQSILDILRPMAEEKKLTMRCIGPMADVRIGHSAALNRVLLNLATNAIKFTNSGSVEVVCTERDRTRVEFAVSDTGRGIPTHVMANLFEAFRQRQSHGDYAFSSAGLGLSICEKLVRAMGGELRVETEVDQGTRFHFTLELPQPPRF